MSIFSQHVLKFVGGYFANWCDSGMGTSAERSSSNTSYYTRGDVLPGIWIDGMDVLAVRNGFEFAIKYAVETGPMVIEVNTYRLVCIALKCFLKFYLLYPFCSPISRTYHPFELILILLYI